MNGHTTIDAMEGEQLGNYLTMILSAIDAPDDLLDHCMPIAVSVAKLKAERTRRRTDRLHPIAVAIALTLEEAYKAGKFAGLKTVVTELKTAIERNSDLNEKPLHPKSKPENKVESGASTTKRLRGRPRKVKS